MANVLTIQGLGIAFWLVIIFVNPKARPSIVVFAHLVACTVSVAAPAFVASAARTVPFDKLLESSLLAFLNGFLALGWCVRAEPRVARLPMLALLATGALLVLMFTFMAATPDRLF